MNFREATKKYEAWLGQQTMVLAADLQLKHQRMAADVFSFLRATFYRWIELWPEVCPDLAKAPSVLAVGDLHVDNFGTWRDSEGRLIWGINDFDEAFPLSYTVDLVRLASSARLAIAANDLALEPKDACAALLSGYMEGLEAGGKAFVLAEQHHVLREMALCELRDPVHFWKKIEDLPTLKHPAQASARKRLEEALPEPGLAYRLAHRVAGLGSLGRERIVAITEWRGGKVAREVKALVASASVWAQGGDGKEEIYYQTILDRAVRCLDPFVQWRAPWILRRLAPDCSRIELVSIPKRRDETGLLHAMGWETANVHLGSKETVKAVLQHLKKQPSDWLRAASKEMVRATTVDWEEWRKG